jgi:hypothetical protein
MGVQNNMASLGYPTGGLLMDGSYALFKRKGCIIRPYRFSLEKNNSHLFTFTHHKTSRKHPFRAAIRWYGRTDAGLSLRDVRGKMYISGV